MSPWRCVLALVAIAMLAWPEAATRPAAQFIASSRLKAFGLTITASGAGSGTVTSNDGQINCTITNGVASGSCSSSAYHNRATVTLTATPSGVDTFSAWSGSGCSGTGTCSVTMTTTRSVVATFALGALTAKCSPSSGTVRYVLSTASGSNNGTNWTNAYTSLSSAETAAARGDTICVGDGTYSSVAFNTPVSGTTVIVVAKATVADHGTSVGWLDAMGDGTATVPDLSFTSTTGYWDVYARFAGPWDAPTAGIIAGDIGVNGSASPTEVHHINLYAVRATALFILANDVLIGPGSDIGGMDGCTYTQEDAVQLWDDGVNEASNRVTFDGVAIHDTYDHGNECAGLGAEHVDCLQMLGGHDITIRNSQFYNCATSDIIGESFRDDLENLTVENNFFGEVNNPGATINFGGKTLYGTNVFQYNTINGQMGMSFTQSGGSFTMRGNIIKNVSTCGAPTYTFNLFFGGSTCGTNAVTGTPGFVSDPAPVYLNGSIPDYHLTAGDTAAKNNCNAPSYPLTDRDGGTRPLAATNPDCGADEYGSP